MTDNPNHRTPWWQRFRAWLGTLRSRAATMGGYWGGVTMRDPKDRDDS